MRPAIPRRYYNRTRQRETETASSSPVTVVRHLPLAFPAAQVAYVAGGRCQPFFPRDALLPHSLELPGI